MILIDPTYISNNCDYSFGDQSGNQHGLSVLKPANISNTEFLETVNRIKIDRNYMTLFIDNIRLYRRSGIKYTSSESSSESMKKFKDDVVSKFRDDDLLKLCSIVRDMNFIIFTGFEDTPIDNDIFQLIPNNVISIYASNSISFGDKVIPIPYGIKRKMNNRDINQDILLNFLNLDISPSKLLYLNFSITNPNRQIIRSQFENTDWATIHQTSQYKDYLSGIKNHKFVICPDGNAIGCECHRDWEVLYMRRVPVVERSTYLEYIFNGFPVLFVDKFEDITQETLIKNNHLYESSLSMKMDNLDMEKLYSEWVRRSKNKINNECFRS